MKDHPETAADYRFGPGSSDRPRDSLWFFRSKGALQAELVRAENCDGGPEATGKEKATILVIEDDADVTSYFVAMFGDNYRTVVASSGRTALQQIEAHDEIAIAVIDYRLPDLSGLEVLRKLKKIRPSLPAILLTGYGNEEVAVKAFRYGAKDYVKKPFRHEDMARKIEFYLSLKVRKEAQRTPVLDESFGEQEAPSPHVKPQQCYYQILRSVRYIDDNYLTEIRRSAAAREAGMSEHHFSRVFKRVTGATYQSYVHGRRIAKAKELLVDGDLTITEIALSVGFADATHFTRIFKKLCSTTPMQFRRSTPDFTASMKKAR